MGRNFIDIKHLTKNNVINILKKAIGYKNGSAVYKERLKDKNIITIFFENSTRTKTSFTIAATNMGANAVNVDYEKSSIKKGETDLDTIRNLSAMHPDAFVVRHFCSGYPHFLSRFTEIPVINAGDGTNEHPSQALLDLLTMYEAKSDIENLNVCIIGDIINSRVARSHMGMAKMFNWNLSFYGPKTMMPNPTWIEGIKIEKNLKDAIENKDFVVLLRIQLERESGQNMPSLGEYAKFFGINENNEPKNAYIMHPGPVNRNVELSSCVMDNGKNILITKQVENGIYARMAVYDFCID